MLVKPEIQSIIHHHVICKKISGMIFRMIGPYGEHYMIVRIENVSRFVAVHAVHTTVQKKRTIFPRENHLEIVPIKWCNQIVNLL